ncbi:MAG: hypothetical protein NVSMB17_12130 [Candidatus Dormibacteria bacterium]
MDRGRVDAAGSAASPRTTAMWVVAAAGVLDVLINVKVLSSRMIPPVAVFTVLLVVFTALTIARHRPWTDLALGIVLGLHTATSAPFIVEGLWKPVASSHELEGILTVFLGVIGTVAGVAAFVEGRRSGHTVPAFRAPVGELLAVLAAGVLIGVSYITTVAYAEVSSSPTGAHGVANGVVSAPTQAPIELTSENASFLQKNLKVQAGAGTVYVVNKDNAEHTFDIDLKGKHYSYPVPAKTTVAVVLDFAAGQYTYYCAISGHRGNGMEGRLTAS